MNLVTKIAKLTRLPQILERKREAERDSKKKRDDSYDGPPFPLKDKPSFKKPRPKTFPKSSKPTSEPKSAKDGIGERIDLTV